MDVGGRVDMISDLEGVVLWGALWDWAFWKEVKCVSSMARSTYSSYGLESQFLARRNLSVSVADQAFLDLDLGSLNKAFSFIGPQSVKILGPS